MDSTAPRMVGQVAGELDTLARQGASGALAITGDPGGTIYLQEGYLAFAERGPLLAGRPDRGRTTSPPDLAVSRWVPPDQRVLRRVLAGLRRLD